MEVANDLCSYGHVGALCEACDLYNVRGTGTFSVTGTLDCADCDKLTGPNSGIIIGISVLSLAFIAFSVRSTMIVNEEIASVQDVEVDIPFYKVVL